MERVCIEVNESEPDEETSVNRKSMPLSSLSPSRLAYLLYTFFLTSSHFVAYHRLGESTANSVGDRDGLGASAAAVGNRITALGV